MTADNTTHYAQWKVRPGRNILSFSAKCQAWPGDGVSVDTGVVELPSVLIARPNNFSPDLSHLVKRRQVRKLWILVEVKGVVISFGL